MNVSALPTIASGAPIPGNDVASQASRRQPSDSTLSAAVQQEEKLMKQFESVMLSMVLKQMRQTGTGENGLFPGDDSDTLGGMFDMYLGEHLAESGGFGLMDSFRGKLLSGPQTLSPQEAANQLRQQATEAYGNVSAATIE